MSDSTGVRGYQIHEFARLTGLTVRALQHYDHLGLLKPVRSRAGHRTYSDQDLQALVQILALKSVGVPLRQIAALRRSGGPGLARFGWAGIDWDRLDWGRSVTQASAACVPGH